MLSCQSDEMMGKVYQTRTSFVLEMLRQSGTLKGTSILDVGFIGGYQEATVHYNIVDSLGEASSLIGIDLDEENLKRFLKSEKTKMRQEKYNLKYEAMSIFDTTFSDGEIDIVLMLEVFEHLLSPYSVFDEIKRILKPCGSIILTYPNPLNWKKMIKFALQRDLLDESYLKIFAGAPDHKVFPHPVCLANYLNHAGFETKAIEFIKYNSGYSFLNTLLLRFELVRLQREWDIWGSKLRDSGNRC